MHGVLRFLLLIAPLVLLPSAVQAQGTLTGTVRDASGAVLPGVTVEASSPALIEKTRTVVTDGTGQYRIIALNPGTYTLTFSLPGFTTVRRQGIELGGTATLTIPAELQVGLEESVSVTAESPVVDVQSARRETVLDNDVIEALPATRTVGALLNVTPGLTVDNNGLAPTPTMTFFSARGGQNNEGRMTVNGMTVAAAFNGGGVSSYILDSVNVDEVSVLVSGGLGETDIGGPVMNLVPRSGGNNFNGQAFFSQAGDWSRGNNLDDRLRAVGITEPPGIISAYDASVSFGGPILRNRIWFFGSYRKLDTSTAVEGIVANRNAFDPNSWRWAPDNSVTARQLQGRTMYIGRATAQVTEKHRLTFGHEYQKRCEGAPLRVETDGCHSREAGWIAAGNATQSPEANTSYFDFPYYMTQATWTAPLTNRLLLEAGVTRFSYYHAGGPGQLPPDGIFDLTSVTEQSTAVDPMTGERYAPRPNYAYRSLATYLDNYGNPNNWRASASYVTGAHDMKVGYQGSWLIAKQTQVTQDSLVSYRFNQGVPNAFTFRLPYWQFEDHTKTASLYVQDTWTLDRLTLQGALRYDRAWSYTPASGNGTQRTSRFNPSPVAFDRTVGVNAYNDITPRVGVAYDVFGTGKTAVKFNVGRYLDAATNDSIYDDSSPARRTVSVVNNRSWTDNDGDFEIDCDQTDFGLQSPATTGSVDTCGALSGEDLNFGRLGQNVTQIDPALLRGWGVRQSDWQWGINVQHEVVPRVSVDVGYNRRWWSGPSATDGVITDDLNRGPEDYEAFTILAPVDPRLPGGGGYPMTFYTQRTAVGPLPARNFTTRESNFGDVSEYWHGVDFTANARLSGGLTLQVGTSTGRKIIDRCDTVTKVDQPTIATTLLVPGLQQATACFSKEPFLTTLRGLAAYTIPWVDVLVSGTFRSQPGDLRTATWVVPNSVIQASLGRLPFGALPNGTTSLALLDNDERRLYADRRRNQVDMRIAKVLRYGRYGANVGVDLGNVLNTNYATDYDNTYQYTQGNTGQGGTWNNPTGVITPRFVRLNITVDF